MSATLVAPDSTTRPVFSGQAAPSTYAFEWSGRGVDGALEPEGLWRWVVSATDDRGQVSSVERPFSLNTTLGFEGPSHRPCRCHAAVRELSHSSSWPGPRP